MKSLFKKGLAFKKYWFIETAVLLGIWVSVIVCNKGDLSAIFSIYWGLSGSGDGLSGSGDGLLFGNTGKKVIGFIYLCLIFLAILISIYKHITVCKSLSCYCEEENPKAFEKEQKLLTWAVGASTFGMLISVPIVYILSFIFRIMFWKFLEQEKKSCTLNLDKNKEPQKEVSLNQE